MACEDYEHPFWQWDNRTIAKAFVEILANCCLEQT